MGVATILYATGTGNSWHAAGVINARLAAAGWNVAMQELRVGVELPKGELSGDLLVLVFPVLGFAMPLGIRKLLRGLRAARGKDGARTPAAVFATWGGAPGAALWQGRGLLRRKGFHVIAAGGASYPFNWTQLINPPKEPDAHGIARGGDADAERFADGLAAALGKGPTAAAGGVPPAVRLPATAALWLSAAWIFRWIGALGLAAMYAADGRCTACGICARDCPVGAIHMAGNGKRRRPRWSIRCQDCNRCINICPEAAIQTSLFRVIVHLPINVAFIVAAVIGCNRLAGLAAQPAWITIPGWIALFTVLVVFLTRLQFFALEPLLFLLEGVPGLRRFVCWSWTVRYRRYRFEGFQSGARRSPAGRSPARGRAKAVKTGR